MPRTPTTSTHRSNNASDYASEGLAAGLWQQLRHPSENALRYQLRAQLLPWTAAAGVASLTGLATAALGAAPAASIALAGLGLAGLWAAAAAVVGSSVGNRWWLAEAHHWIRAHPTRTRAIVATAGGWSMLALTSSDPHLIATAGLAGFYSVSAHYWRTVRIPTPDTTSTASTEQPAAPAQKEVDADTAFGAHIIALWHQHLATTLREVELSHHEPTTTGHEFRITTPAGSRGMAEVYAARDQITTTLAPAGIAPGEITIHPDPSNGQRATLRLATRSPIAGNPGVAVTPDAKQRLWVDEQPLWDPDRGVVTLGQYEDLSAYREWVLYPHAGMRGGIIIGASEGGKTGTIKLLIRGAYESGCTTVWHVDGQGGASIEGTSAYVDWEATTPPQWDEVLDAALAAMAERNDAKSVYGWTFTPSPDYPGLLIIVDECHRVLSERAAEWSLLAREGRKVGIALVLATQNTKSADSLGSTTLRDELGDKNVIVHRMKTASARRVLPHLEADAGALRAEPGWAVSPPSPGPGGAALAYTPWRAGNIAPYLTQEDTTTITPVLLNPATEAACPESYRRRNSAEKTAERAATRAAREAYDAGHITWQQYQHGTTPATARTVATTPNPIALPDQPLFTTIQLAHAHQTEEEEPELSGGQQAVLDALRAGHSSGSAIALHSGLSRSSAYEALTRLQHLGMANRTDRGQYIAA